MILNIVSEQRKTGSNQHKYQHQIKLIRTKLLYQYHINTSHVTHMLVFYSIRLLKLMDFLCCDNLLVFLFLHFWDWATYTSVNINFSKGVRNFYSRNRRYYSGHDILGTNQTNVFRLLITIVALCYIWKRLFTCYVTSQWTFTKSSIFFCSKLFGDWKVFSSLSIILSILYIAMPNIRKCILRLSMFISAIYYCIRLPISIYFKLLLFSHPFPSFVRRKSEKENTLRNIQLPIK